VDMERRNDLLAEARALHRRQELSQNLPEHYFEPGMMEYLDQFEGHFDPQTGALLLRFEVKGIRYEGRTELCEKLCTGQPVRILREKENPYNSNNFKILTEKGRTLGNLPAQLCNAMAPLVEGGELILGQAKISFVEPISKRSRHAKQAILFVELQAQLII